ncbi:MAG: hypothetical protein BZY80_02915 [SAR202 cluster bacterium Io17-Chloro-G2]|nr:MAG: hypothetical protein BZY80_02915 [SAR202 cluster bacterium Io17-Chloro-G2]
MVTKEKATIRFRQLLAQPEIIMAPGAYDCLTAKIIEQAGFPAVYMTGAGTSVARLGQPDLALATMTEMLANAAAIAGSVDVPVIADADTGYGGVLNVGRTVRLYERTGVAAIHIEDQESPKRCGHLDNKRVIPADEMVQKIHAAVDARIDGNFTIIVRTDALAVTGWDDTMERCQAYVEAGADVLFVEAVRSKKQAQLITRRFEKPMLYNFVESGKSPLIPAGELQRLGFKLVIFPASALLLVTKAVAGLMAEIKNQGTPGFMIDQMVSLEDCFNLVGMAELLAQDAKYAGQMATI